MLCQGAIVKSMMIWYHNSTLMYANLYGDKDSDRRYGEGVMPVSVKEFQTHALHISDDVKNNDRWSHLAFIVSTRFNPMHINNNLRYLEVNRNTPTVQDSD